MKPSEQFDDSFNILRIDFDGFKEEEQKTLRLVGSFGFSHFLDRNAFYRFRGKPFERQKGFWNGEDVINIDSRINLTRCQVKSIIDGAIHLDGYYRIFLICGNQKVCIRDGKKNRKFRIKVDESDIYGDSITLLRNSTFQKSKKFPLNKVTFLIFESPKPLLPGSDLQVTIWEENVDE